jgi:hypothetical protein
MKLSVTGLVGSILCILLSCILLFWNPYSSNAVGRDAYTIIFIMLILPACCGAVGSIWRVRFLMGVVLIWSLPYGIYLSVASVPSLFNLYAVVLLLYAISIIMIGRRVQ